MLESSSLATSRTTAASSLPSSRNSPLLLLLLGWVTYFGLEWGSVNEGAGKWERKWGGVKGGRGEGFVVGASARTCERVTECGGVWRASPVPRLGCRVYGRPRRASASARGVRSNRLRAVSSRAGGSIFHAPLHDPLRGLERGAGDLPRREVEPLAVAGAGTRGVAGPEAARRAPHAYPNSPTPN